MINKTQIDSQKLEYFHGKKGFVQIIKIANKLGLLTDVNIEKSYAAAKAYLNNDTENINYHLIKNLENKLYESLNRPESIPDYSVYNDNHYIIDIYNCWITYSRKYLSNIQKTYLYDSKILIKDYLSNCNNIIDLGCGMGLTTWYLKNIFPKKNVYGTNIETTFQYKIAEYFSHKNNFHIVSNLNCLPKNSLVFASEYFEHHERPVEHLYTVIKKLKPKYFLIANGFNADAIGHFNIYKHLDKKLSSKEMNKFFNNSMKHFGYIKIKTKLWNNRPVLWARK